MAALTRDLDRYERVLREQGFTRIAGVDEAGRGALAGPLVAAAVILPEGFDLEGIDDSKVLTRLQREAAFERIRAGAIAFAVRKIEPGVIDARGLHRSNIALLRRCVNALDVEPDYVLTDGFPVPKMPCMSLGIKKGDAVAASVAAAGIVAKVTRDGMMRRLHRRYADFGFDHNKGYGTPEHWEVLDRLGPTPIHRLSFAGVGQPSLPGSAAVMWCVRERMADAMESDDIERFEEERELELYREYRDVLPMFTYVIETERRFYLANKVDIAHLDGGWVQVDLADAWVWDMFRPARFVASVRVMTRRDVNVEELARREEPTTLPEA